jgi:hypothetical protein
MWQICRQSKDGHLRGGVIDWRIAVDDAICLRHVLTGEYLTSSKPRKDEARPGAASARKSGKTNWNIVDQTLLRTDMSTTALRTSDNTRFSFKREDIDATGVTVHDGALCQILNDAHDTSTYVHFWQQHLEMKDKVAVHLSNQASDEDVFCIQKVEGTYLRDCTYEFGLFVCNNLVADCTSPLPPSKECTLFDH